LEGLRPKERPQRTKRKPIRVQVGRGGTITKKEMGRGRNQIACSGKSDRPNCDREKGNHEKVEIKKRVQNRRRNVRPREGGLKEGLGGKWGSSKARLP